MQFQVLAERAGLRWGDHFDYDAMGETIGSFCPLLCAQCTEELNGDCPYPGDDDCPDENEWDLIVTANGFLTRDPLTDEGFIWD